MIREIFFFSFLSVPMLQTPNRHHTFSRDSQMFSKNLVYVYKITFWVLPRYLLFRDYLINSKTFMVNRITFKPKWNLNLFVLSSFHNISTSKILPTAKICQFETFVNQKLPLIGAFGYSSLNTFQ